jgi:hypothetical protein
MAENGSAVSDYKGIDQARSAPTTESRGVASSILALAI